eukprot:2613775-Pyramimonas_sp.AAC.1
MSRRRRRRPRKPRSTPLRAISPSAVLWERHAPSRGATEQPSRRRTAKPSAGSSGETSSRLFAPLPL